jgi:hypothetical protein
MATNKHILFDETESGKYIIVKIPRKTLNGNMNNPLKLFSDYYKYSSTLRMIGFILIFLLGIIIGSIYHDHILTINSDHATWKMFTMTSNGH